MSIFILTLTWNQKEKLIRLKNSLLPALQGLNYTWLIKDNNSNDGTFEEASAWGPNIKVFKYPNNLQNFSEGCNYLFKLAKPEDDDYILLLNNDVIFNDTTSLKNMINIMKKDNEVGVVGARLLYTNTNKLQHAGVVFDDRYKFPTHFKAGQISDKDSERNREFQAVTGAVLLTKALYYKQLNLNGMEEKFSWAFDDIDLCLNIKYKQNKKIVYCGKTNISHDESASLKKNPVNKMFLSNNLNLLTSKWSKFYVIDKATYTNNKNHKLYE